MRNYITTEQQAPVSKTIVVAAMTVGLPHMLPAFETVTAEAAAAVATFGLPVLFAIFVLKGVLIGKILPTSIFLPGYVLAVGATYRHALFVVIVVTTGHIIGQVLLYLGIQRYGPPFLAWLPYPRGDGTDSSKLDGWFDQHGGKAVFATNIIPWTRGLIAIPAALSSYSLSRYTFHATTSTLIYHGIYAVAPVVGVGLLY